jgi:hypothetical protein
VTISRPSRPSWPRLVAIGVAGILIGIGVGVALGGGDDEPDPVQGLRDARSSLGRAADVLEIVAVEYAEGVEDGRVVSAAEYDGARRAVARSRSLYGDARPVVAYASAVTATRLDHAFPRLARKVAARAPEEEVAADARRLAATMERAIAPGD